MRTRNVSGLSGYLMALGPGILFAGAAIGGSHLVWSTRAGAEYGFNLLWIVLLVNLFKYPFFEFACRYTAATGETMLTGYRRAGSWVLWSFFVIALVSAVLNIAALTLTTAVLAQGLAGGALTPLWWSVVTVAVCLGILVVGRYALLDSVMKVIVLVLAVSTVAACAMAAARGSNAAPGFQAPHLWNALGLAFLLNLMGWMPAPIDVAVFPSVWAVERRKQTGHFATLGEALVDFNIGYIGTVLMAVFFLALGAFVMFGTGESFGESGIVFSQKLYELYTGTLGGWSFWLVATAGFTCIFSSTLTCFDAYTRMLHACLFHREGVPEERTTGEDRLHWALLAFLAVCTLLLVSVFKSHMLNALKLATVIAFLTAPFVAAINLRVITGPHMPSSARPPRWMMILSWAGLVFLSGFALLYLWVMAAVGVG